MKDNRTNHDAGLSDESSSAAIKQTVQLDQVGFELIMEKFEYTKDIPGYKDLCCRKWVANRECIG